MHELKIIEKYCGHSMDYTFLPDDEQEARKLVHKVMLAVVERGGEGVYLRDPSSPWTPMRTNSCIKVKGCLDAEGTLVEFMPGLGKYLGVIGSLRLKWNGKSIQVSGLTDEERGSNSPFKIGDTITFKFREFTVDGYPKEPRFDRVRYQKGDLR
jgi:DNA ligase-1